MKLPALPGLGAFLGRFKETPVTHARRSMTLTPLRIMMYVLCTRASLGRIKETPVTHARTVQVDRVYSSNIVIYLV